MTGDDLTCVVAGGPRPRLSVRGELHLRTRDQLIRAAVDALSRGEALDIDLSGVAFCDSTGVSALVAVRNIAHMDGKRVVIVHPSPPVERLLDVVDLLDDLTDEPHSSDAPHARDAPHASDAPRPGNAPHASDAPRPDAAPHSSGSPRPNAAHSGDTPPAAGPR